MPNIITPYLPPVAEVAVKAWTMSNRPAFVKALEHNMIEFACPNCGGVGVVYVVFCEQGPARGRFANTVYTWYEGDGKYPKGMYVINRTEAYQCPECKGLDHKRILQRPTSARPTAEEIHAIIAKAAGRLEKDGQRRKQTV